MKDFIRKMFSAGDDVSSKRVIGFLSWILFAIIAMVDQFSKYKANGVIVDNLMYIILGVFVAGALEVFGRRTGGKPAPVVHVASVENVQVTETPQGIMGNTTTPQTKPTAATHLEANEIIG